MDTPELDKQHAIIESGEADTITRFYDWLVNNGYVIAVYVNSGYYDDPRLFPAYKRPEELFADFFGIDLDKIEIERNAILERLHNYNHM